MVDDRMTPKDAELIRRAGELAVSDEDLIGLLDRVLEEISYPQYEKHLIARTLDHQYCSPAERGEAADRLVKRDALIRSLREQRARAVEAQQVWQQLGLTDDEQDE